MFLRLLLQERPAFSYYLDRADLEFYSKSVGRSCHLGHCLRKERVMFLPMADRLLLPSSLLSLHIIGTSITIITYHRLQPS